MASSGGDVAGYVSTVLDGVNWSLGSGSCWHPLSRRNVMPAVTEEEVRSALKQCYDPEIPVNIVDLGLIYAVRFEAAGDEQQDVSVDLTLTSPGCPSHVMIGEQVKNRLEQLPGIRTATVNVVWTPPWTPERLSPEARTQLGIE